MRRRTLGLSFVALLIAVMIAYVVWRRVPPPCPPGGPFAPGTTVDVVHRELVAEANRNYRFGPERNPETVPPNQPNTTGMTIASAVRKDSDCRVAGARFVGRITATSPYARLGILRGVNYLWTDSAQAWAPDSGPSRVLVVPASQADSMFWLKIDSVHARMRSTARTSLRPTLGSLMGFSLTFNQADANQGLDTSLMTDPEPLLRVTSSTAIEACTDGCTSGHCASGSVWRLYEPTTDNSTLLIYEP